MNKLYIVLAIFIILPLFLGAAGMVTIIAAKFSQTPTDQSAPPTTDSETPSPTTNYSLPTTNSSPTPCGDGICSKVERTTATCAIDC